MIFRLIVGIEQICSSVSDRDVVFGRINRIISNELKILLSNGQSLIAIQHRNMAVKIIF